MSRQLFFAMNNQGRKQVDRDTALLLALINERLNISSRSFVGTEKTIEEIFDCIGEEVVTREVTRKFHRVTIELPYIPSVYARFKAYAMGVAAAPTGATANKIMTLTIADATVGTFTVTLPAYDGYGAFPSAPIPYNFTLAQLKWNIENIDGVGFGNTAITDLTGGVYQIELIGKRAAAPVPTFTAQTAGLNPEATVVIAQTQAGSQRSHAITEMPSYQAPYTSFVMGFEDEPGSERELVGAVVDAVRVNIPEGNAVMTMSADIICRDLIGAAGFVVPACVVPRPYRLSDCLLTHAGTDYTPILVDGAFSYANNTVTGAPAFTGRGQKFTRANRARRRTRSLTFRLLGGLQQALRLEAETNPEADIHRATSLRLGVEGDNVTENIPNNLLTVDAGGGGVDFQADTDDSINRYVSAFDKAGSTPPSNSVAHIAQAVALLQVPA